MAIKALLYDKDREIYPLLGDIFNVTGHKLLVAPDENIFKELVASTEVDIIMINKADINSWLSVLRENRIILPFFIADTEEEEERLKRLGFSELNYIRKPFNPLELLNKLVYLEKLNPLDSAYRLGLINTVIKLFKTKADKVIELSNSQVYNIVVEKGQVSYMDCTIEELRNLVSEEDYKVKVKDKTEEIRSEVGFKHTYDFLKSFFETVKPVTVKVKETLPEFKFVEEVEKGIYRISKFASTKIILKNVYLRIYEGNGKKIAFLINIGTIDEWSGIKNLVEDTLLGMDKLDGVILLSGDLASIYNAFLASQELSKVQFITDNYIKRNLVDSGFKSGRIRTLGDFISYRARLATGHTLRFIPLGFSPSVGSFCLYEEDTGILFTPEFLSSFYSESEKDKDKVKAIFHRIFIPSGSVLSGLIEKIRNLNVKKVLPRYGLPYDNFSETIRLLEGLRTGTDLKPLDSESKAKNILQEVINIVATHESRDILERYIEGIAKYGVISGKFVEELFISPAFAVELAIKELLSLTSVKPSTIISALGFISAQNVYINPF